MKPVSARIASKLVVLKLEGDWERSGLRATLEIGPEHQRPTTEVQGALPASDALVACWRSHWLETYRSAELPVRIKPKRVQTVRDVQHWRQACRASSEQFVTALQHWLASPEFRPLDQRLREELHTEETIRFHIQADDPRLHQLPWHGWDFFQRYAKAEWIASAPRPTYAIRARSRRVTSWPRLRILAILGHSDGIDVEADRQLLQQLPEAETLFLVEPRRQELSDRLWEQPWDIIFFAGHSETEGEVGRIYLNSQESLTIDELWYALRKAADQGLQLAIFNSCDGLGLVRQLDDLAIPQLVVMREMVPDQVAQAFLKYFLQALARGESSYLAVREARERLQGLEDEFPCASWLPALCQHPTQAALTWQPRAVRGRWRSPRFLASLAAGAAAALAGAWFGLPWLGVRLNNYAYLSFLAGDRPASLWALEWAQRVDPGNAAVLYNQATQCERVQDWDCAHNFYRQAARLGMAAAYSNLARLYILHDEDYAAAVELVQEGLQVADSPPDRYALHKNLGWARLEQGRYVEARQALNTALALDGERAAAHCLSALLAEAAGQETAALSSWRRCQELAEPVLPDDDRWLGMAQQRL